MFDSKRGSLLSISDLAVNCVCGRFPKKTLPPTSASTLQSKAEAFCQGTSRSAREEPLREFDFPGIPPLSLARRRWGRKVHGQSASEPRAPEAEERTLSDIEERQVGELTIQIDRLICVGFGDCVEASPEAFVLDDDGIATLLPGADAVTPADLIAACRTCPVDAFVVLDPDGKQIVP